MTALAAYRILTRLAGPLVPPYLQWRRLGGKEDPLRLGERLGRASMPRPSGRLAWLHAASVGESVSLLPLIERLGSERPWLHLLVTTGTVTSARQLASRLPARARHHFVPVDRPRYVARFLDHWRPDLVIWAYSDFWPNLLAATHGRGIPAALVNGRMSERSFVRWQRWPGLSEALLSPFSPCLGQDAVQRERLRRLGAAGAETVGDLRAAAPPLAVDRIARERLAAAIGHRPFWLAASTHEGEEEAAAAAHLALTPVHPGLLTIIVPRHPSRADAIAAALHRRGLDIARRSRNEPIAPAIDVYLADTLGELGTFYDLAELAFIGGSLARHGGHNPMEAARLGCAVLHGPDMSNCAAMTADLRAGGGALAIADAETLAAAVGRLLGDAAERRRLAAAARAVAERETGVLDRVMARLAPLLDRLDPPAPQAAPRDDARACA